MDSELSGNGQETTVQPALTSAVLEQNPLIHTHMYTFHTCMHRCAQMCTCVHTTHLLVALLGFSQILG